jgi:hypothetical protein
MRMHGWSWKNGCENERRQDFPGGDSLEIKHAASLCFDNDHLSVAIIPAGRAGDVRGHFTAAVRAVFKERSTPTVCTTAHFLTTFGLAALWNGHGLTLV